MFTCIWPEQLPFRSRRIPDETPTTVETIPMTLKWNRQTTLQIVFQSLLASRVVLVSYSAKKYNEIKSTISS